MSFRNSPSPVRIHMDRDPAHSDAQIEKIIEGLKNLPTLEPPPDLLSSVMAAATRKKRPWYYRLPRWATAPRCYTFTPLKAAPVALVLLLILGFSTIHLFRQDEIHVQDGRPGGVPVTLTLQMEGASSVEVVGSFNAWRGEGYRMQKQDDGRNWNLTIVLPEGRHEYAFVIDGKELVTDPHAFLYREDGFGNRNAVLLVESHNEQAI
jgi:hypothetical protein